jgi:uncharacterized coiled-coil protein SlyX
MFYPPCPDYNPAGYDPPFTPRYSVPESFRRALSYEGQIHWLAGLYDRFESMVESNVNFWVVDSTDSFDRETADGFLNKEHAFDVTWPADGPVSGTGVTVATGDVVAVRFTDTTDGGMCFLMGNVVDACRCVTPERWNVAVRMVVHDITAKFDGLSAKVGRLETKVDGFDTRIKTVETKVNSLDTLVTAITTDVSKLKIDVAELKGKVTSLTERVAKLETDVGNRVTVEDFNKYKENMANTINSIIYKFYGNGTIGDNGTIKWGFPGKAAVGNMNVYGGNSNYIMTRDGTVSTGSDNDVRVV